MKNIIPPGEENLHSPENEYAQHCDCIPDIFYNEQGELVCLHRSSKIEEFEIAEEREQEYENFKREYQEELDCAGGESWIIMEWANTYACEKISAGKFRDLVRKLLTSKIKNEKKFKNNNCDNQ